MKCQRKFNNCLKIAIGYIKGVAVCKQCLEWGERDEYKAFSKE